MYHFHFSNEHDLNNESWAVLVPAFFWYRAQRIWKLEIIVLGMTRFHDKGPRLSGTTCDGNFKSCYFSKSNHKLLYHCVQDLVKYLTVQWSHDLISYYTLIDNRLQNRRKACSCNCYKDIIWYLILFDLHSNLQIWEVMLLQ